MSFLIKYDDITNTWFQTTGKMKAWGEQLASVQERLGTFLEMSSFQGTTAESLKCYIGEVHSSILQSLGLLMSEYEARFLLYRDGYYQEIDGDLHAELCEETLDDLLQFFPKSEEEFCTIHGELRKIANSVSDLVYEDIPTEFYVLDSYSVVKRRLLDLKDKTNSYEERHRSGGLESFTELLSSVRQFIQGYIAEDHAKLMGYQPGAMGSSSGFEALQTSFVDLYMAQQSLADDLNAAGEREGERISILEEEWAAARAEAGMWQWIAGAGAVIVGGICIVATCGAATPLVVAGFVAGGSAIIYGASEMGQAEQEISYGLAGDPYSVSTNFIRDTVFFGNQEAYSTWGMISTTVAGLLIPVGQGYTAAVNAAKSVGGTATRTMIARSIAFEVGKDLVSGAVGYGATQLGGYLGTEAFGESAGKWIGIGAGLFAGFATNAAFMRLDKAVNISGLQNLTPDAVGVVPGMADGADSIIERVKNGDVVLETTKQKGNFGEMVMDDYYKQLGYERISLDQVTDLDGAIKQGIDGVYYKSDGNPPYIIAEAKYGTSTLSNTLDGKQMSESWINGSNRLERAVGIDLADDILLEGYKSELVNIASNGSVDVKQLNSLGNVIK